MREMARVVRPGGYVLAEFYNARSLRRLVKALKPPTAVSEQTHDEHVYTRYDDARRDSQLLARTSSNGSRRAASA